MTATAKQIGYIHALAGKAGMDDEARHDFLRSRFGVASSKDLSVDQAITVIDALKPLAGLSRAIGAVAGLDTPVARKMRALWIAAHDLGLLTDRSDRAMLSFLERQTGISHTRFLNAPGQAQPAIEALKVWLARDGEVYWPGKRASTGAMKRAVLNAQWMRLIAIGAVEPFLAEKPLNDLDSYAFRVTWKHGWEFFTGEDYAEVQNALGRKLRHALAKAAKKSNAARGASK